jgi:hypothetical protein
VSSSGCADTSLGGLSASGEGVSEPRKSTIQQQAGLVRGLLGPRKLGPWFGAPWRRLQLPQPEVAGMGPATAGTQEATLLESLVEEDLHGRFLLA